MGWNDSRVSLLPLGWTMGFEENTTGARTADGTPVRIAYSERLESSESAGIDRGAVEAWLETRVFNRNENERVAVACSGKMWNHSWKLRKASSLESSSRSRCPSTLRRVGSRGRPWCGKSSDWDLSLYDSNLGFNVEAGEILRVLASTQAWRDFEERFGWPPVTSVEE